MTLKSRTRRWLNAAPDAELQALRAEMARLAGEVGTARSQGQAGDARRDGEVQALRGELHGVRDALAALADRFEAHADRTYATADDLAELERRIMADLPAAGEADIARLRLALTGLGEQLRWEADDLRKSLAAIIERVERERRLD